MITNLIDGETYTMTLYTNNEDENGFIEAHVLLYIHMSSSLVFQSKERRDSNTTYITIAFYYNK
jgi:hypothetical protein